MPKWTIKHIKKDKIVGEVEDRYAFFNKLLTQEISEPVQEHKFHPKRKWKIDFSYPDKKLAIEIEGGVWSRGRHTRGSGFIKDMEKYNALTEYGWRLLRFTPDDLKKQSTLDLIKKCYHSSP